MRKTIYCILLILCILCTNLNTFAYEDWTGYFPFDYLIQNKSSDKMKLFDDASIENGTLTSGISGNGILCNGNNTYIKISDTKNNLTDNNCILSVWAKPKTKNSSSEDSPIINIENLLTVGIEKETKKFYINYKDNISNINYTAIENKWYNIVLSLENNKIRLFINGEFLHEIMATDSYSLNNSDIYIGKNGTNYFYGIIDELKIYNHIFSDHKIKKLYTDMMGTITEWENVSFPLKTMFPQGINSANTEIFKKSKLSQPLYTGYEERNEINSINTQNYKQQLSVSEDKYNGKFALKISKNHSDIVPLKESAKFKSGSLNKTSSSYAVSNKQSFSKNGVNISINDKTLIIDGIADAGKETTIRMTNNDKIEYINQTTNDDNGKFMFKFDVSDYGNYLLAIGGTDGIRLEEYIDVIRKELITTEEIESKCNHYTLMIKPMYNSQSISFYTKAETITNGVTSEEYVLIKSDSDGDGVFEIGKDLSRGKWQKLELNLLDITEENITGVFSGLYMNANETSQWLFDEISSEFKKINTNKINLSGMAASNVVYKDGSLQFGNTINNKEYNVNPAVITGGINIDEKIAGFTIDNSMKQLIGISQNNVVLLAKTPLSDEKWIVNDESFDSEFTYVSKKIDKTEILDENDNKDIVIKPLGSAQYLSTFRTSNRVKLSIDYLFDSGSNTGTFSTIQILVYNANKNKLIYSGKQKVDFSSTKSNVNIFIPKIEEDCIIEIQNLAASSENSSNKYNIRLLNVNFEENIGDALQTIKGINGYSIYSRTFFQGEHETLSTKCARDITDENELYAVENEDLKGYVNETNSKYLVRVTGTRKTGYRIINLSKEPSYVELNGNTYWLDYGENEIIVDQAMNIYLPPNQRVILLSVIEYEEVDANPNNISDIIVNGLSSVYSFSSDGNKIYYKNIFDNSYLYEYDFITKEYHLILEQNCTQIVCSPDDTHLFLKVNNTNGIIYNLETKEKGNIKYTSSGKFVFNADNELYTVSNGLITKYLNGSWNSDGFTKETDESLAFDFDKSGNFMVAAYKYDKYFADIYIYEKHNNVWNSIKEIRVPTDYKMYTIKNCIISDDLTTVYLQGSIGIMIDIVSGAITEVEYPGTIIQKCNNGTLLCQYELLKECYYYIFDPVTKKKYKIFDKSFKSDYIRYYPESNTIMFITGNKTVARFEFSETEPEVKYLLSFDGRNNWYSYANGRWILSSKNYTPTEAEISSSGMTATQVNEIPENAIKKLYENDTDILKVDFAAYMYSYSTKKTPVIEKIEVETLEDDELDGIYGVNIKKFDKIDYRKINSVFPIENFMSNTECYYLLYIGNEWLYTYKNGNLVKVVESADELLDDITDSWITFKQYGLTASELRNIPSNVLNELFVNENYANTEFGIIYVVKTNDTDTTKYTVDFKIQSESNYITQDDVVIEIMMNGNDKKVIDSRKFSKNEIEELLSWIEARQNGAGDIFHSIKNSDVQYLINYFMINSINVYNGEEYRNQNT